MIYTVSLSCSHTENREIHGNPEQIAQKINWLEKKGLCKACYIEKKKEEPSVLNIARYNDGTRESYREKIILFVTGNTYTIREQLQNEGYRLSVLPPIGLKGVVQKNRKAWNKTCTLGNLELEIALLMPYCQEKINTLTGIDEMVMSQYHPRYQEAMEKIQALSEPSPPEWLQNMKITEKIYGRPGNYSIYSRAGEKVEITDENAQDLQRYFKEKAAYQQKILKIKDSIN